MDSSSAPTKSTRFSVIMPFTEGSSERRKNIAAWVFARYTATWDVDQIEIIVGLDDSEPFNRSRARNGALQDVSSDVVLIADMDTAFDPHAIEEGIQMVRSGEAPWVIPYAEHQYYNLTHEYTDRLLQESPTDPIWQVSWDFKLLSWAGLLIARTDDVRKVGGYDERFQGWGWEDNAFRIVMDHHVGPHQRTVRGRALHLWHERNNADFNIPDEIRNRELFDREYRKKYNWIDERIRRTR